MRIAYFNADLRRGQDGVSRCMYKVIEGAIDRNFKAIAFTSILPEEKQKIIPMYRVPSVALPLQKTYKIAVAGYKYFASELKKFDPDIMHVNSPCTLGFAAVKYAQHYSVPIVATYHTHFPSYLQYYKIKSLEEITWKVIRKFYNNVDKTFVPSLTILNELEAEGIQNLEYLPNGVDLELFSQENRSQKFRESINAQNKTVILFVSRLVWEKNLRVLADMYNILKQHRDDFEMVIVGEGHARQKFEEMMPDAHFLGFQTGMKLAEIYASSDIFAFPSTTETFGLVTIEAMASGLVPVAARKGGAIGIIEDGKSGLLTKPLDAEDMAQKIEWLINNPEIMKDFSKNATNRAKDFEWEKILNRLFTRYDEIIKEFRLKKGKRAA